MRLPCAIFNAKDPGGAGCIFASGYVRSDGEAHLQCVVVSFDRRPAVTDDRFVQAGVVMRQRRSGLTMRRGATALALCFASAAAMADPGNIDPLIASESVPCDARSGGTAGAGVALPGGLARAALNPALPRAFARQTTPVVGMAFAGYGRQPPFSTHVVPVGIAINAEASGLWGTGGRFLERGKERRVYDAFLLYGGRFFDQNTTQGAVDFGVRIRYGRANWMVSGLDTLVNERYVRGADGLFERDSLWPSLSVPSRGRVLGHQLALDVGFYQARIADNIDFGLVFHDLVGRLWEQERPWIESRRVDTAWAWEIPQDGGDPVEIPTVYHIEREYVDTLAPPHSRWYEPHQRRVTAGIVFRTPLLESRLWLLIPADLELIGLFDRAFKTRFVIRTGVEGVIMERLALRAGYARELSPVQRGEVPQTYRNRFTAGAGVLFSPVMVDVALGRDRWLLTASVVF